MRLPSFQGLNLRLQSHSTGIQKTDASMNNNIYKVWVVHQTALIWFLDHIKCLYIQSFLHLCNRRIPEKHCISEEYINEHLIFHIVELSDDNYTHLFM